MRVRMFIIFIGCIAPISWASAGPTPASGRTTDDTTEPSASGASSPQSNSSASDGSDGESNNVAGFDSDGMPILKRKSGPEREKIIELKDGQKLPTSGVDPKFQGSLLNTSVDSIVGIVPNTNKDRGANNEDLRFKTKDLSLTKESGEPQKKNGPNSANSDADSSPSPTPSPTASPALKASPKQ